ncbi:acetyl-CoA carboxylase biotin carboxylase subunit family protein [Bradyrhizobium sp. 188]|uniref:ATP-grasp domain-containing protein n=1 Tax=Bradyrhizobium sp. 188 TaxID=2782656 RepID=UPI001FFA730E|nr:acetyl-CoA carboxylase biotin carboxylase subunit family protein [Bradyrhizobium sp. 188]MCK1499358.1 acetyl-CoA carboxylase biotin carboxylase subunit family protein [Bradyrhizobium sp. 188]
MTRTALVMVEGASNCSLFVRAAKHLGFQPIVLSANPARYKYLAAEEIEPLYADTHNLDALIGKCYQLRGIYDISGITSSSELFYAIAAKLCLHFGLPGPNPTSIERCRDKFNQRQLLTEAGISVPAYRQAASAAAIQSSAAEIGLPVIVKPAVGIASSGVRLCRNSDELAEHADYLLGGTYIWPSSPSVLVEEFAQGPHYSIEMMGDQIVGIAAADFGHPPHFVCRKYSYPALLSDEQHKRIAEISLRSLQALGLSWGPKNIDLRWTKLGPVVIEVNPRLGGTPAPQLVQLAYGVDLVTEHLKVVVGRQSDLSTRQSHTAAARVLLPERDGTLDWITGESRAAALPGVAEVKLYVKPGAPIVRKGDSQDRLGYVIVTSPSSIGTEAILDCAVDLIDWSITPFPTPIGQQ